jgi:hypothetical protein
VALALGVPVGKDCGGSQGDGVNSAKVSIGLLHLFFFIILWISLIAIIAIFHPWILLNYCFCGDAGWDHLVYHVLLV